MEITPESIREQIPYYLTQGQKDGLLRGLQDFPENINYYLNSYQDELLQGDGWNKLQVRNFYNGDQKAILGIILSNTCDVDSENKRDLPVKITFSPIIPLRSYVSLLENYGVNTNKIQDKLKSIKYQEVTNIFFLPAGGSLLEDHIALLDEVYTIPATSFELEKAKAKFFTLSLVGFYLFLFKISIHFCRFNENVAR